MGHWLRDFMLSPERPRSRNASEYARLPMPALVVWGDRDPVTPLPQGEHLVRALPNAVLHVLPGIGHIPHVEDGAAVNAALLGFLPR